MTNKICHFEIGCRDRAKAARFYSQVFDWKIEQKGDQAMLRTGDDVGGHLHSPGHEPHPYTIFYVMVEDVAAALNKAESLGGKKLMGPLPVPGGGGTFGWFADPEGNTIGVYAE
ncbi:MAG TPA: VOC family protein [Terriglobales bacterium]|nr:VOC family protein [Terriglobales bacterium]